MVKTKLELVSTETKFKIEKGVPIPKRVHRCQYPFYEMEVGDSFFVPNKKPSQMTGYYSLLKTTRPSMKITCRSEGNGVRVWRIK